VLTKLDNGLYVAVADAGYDSTRLNRSAFGYFYSKDGIYWSKDLNSWDPEHKAVVLDGPNCKWSHRCIELAFMTLPLNPPDIKGNDLIHHEK
jgi:hypothetical protein